MTGAAANIDGSVGDAQEETPEPIAFGEYLLHRRIAEGGMAEIFLAEKQAIADFSRVVVLKRMLPHLESTRYVKMFLDEARLASRLSHPNVVQVHDFGEVDGRYYLAMEYLAGETLSTVLRRHRKNRSFVPPEIAIWIVRSMLEGLHHAHEYREGGKAMNIVHRDVSPSNVMVTYQGSVKLVDFGIARAADRVQEKTLTGVLKGKRAYASPEQYRGESLDRRADVWATGVVLHELCTGTRLFRKDTPEATMHAVLQSDIPDPRAVRGDLPDGLYAVLLRALSRDRSTRYATAREMSRELEALMLGAPPRVGEWLRGLFGNERAQEVLDVREGISKIERLSAPPEEPTTPQPDPTPIAAEPGRMSDAPTTVERSPSHSRSETPPPEVDPEPDAVERAALSAPPVESPNGSRQKVRTVVLAIGVLILAVGIGYGLRSVEQPATEPTDASTQSESDRARYLEAFEMAQSGGHEEARVHLDAHLTNHPDDADALVLRLFVQWWASAPRIETQLEQARAAALDDAQRVTIEGVAMVNEGRNAQAAAFLAPALEEHPDRPELLYVLGEAQWHGQQYRVGVDTLTKAIEADPRWRIALHHTIEFHLDQGEAEEVHAIADLLADTDPARSAALHGQALIAEQKYAEAVTLLEDALNGDYANEPHLWVVLSQARILAGEYDTAEFGVRRAFETWPVDDREVGGAALMAELSLYRGQLGQFASASSGVTSVGRLMDALWRGEGRSEPRRPPRRGLLSPPLYVMAHFEDEHTRGRDEELVWNGYPEVDLAALGEGLTAERADRMEDAGAAYERGLSAPQSGWARMLLSHHLARTRASRGDAAGAAEACAAVLRPRVYRTYRAVVLPDCEVWTAEAGSPEEAQAIYRALVDRWSGNFVHSAIVKAHDRLEAP